jgi:uncharacterized membrane protein YuzA (DUF378 family)
MQLCKISFLIACVGAMMWALTTISGFNPVAKIFGKESSKSFWAKAFRPENGFATFYEYSLAERFIYFAIGAAGAYALLCEL